MNARPSGGGQDGHLNHACVLGLFCGDRLDFQTNDLGDFFFHASGPLKERSRSHLGPPRQGRGLNTHDNLDYFVVTGWNLPLVELENELENN